MSGRSTRTTAVSETIGSVRRAGAPTSSRSVRSGSGSTPASATTTARTAWEPASILKGCAAIRAASVHLARWSGNQADVSRSFSTSATGGPCGWRVPKKVARDHPGLVQEAERLLPGLRRGSGKALGAFRKMALDRSDAIRVSRRLESWADGRQASNRRRRERARFAADLETGRRSLDFLKRPLLPYQIEGVLHLAFGERALLADDMGLGKTVQAIAACALLRELRGIERVLVVSPASPQGRMGGTDHDLLRLPRHRRVRRTAGPPRGLRAAHLLHALQLRADRDRSTGSACHATARRRDSSTKPSASRTGRPRPRMR